MKVPGRQRRLGGRRAKTRRSSRDQSRKRFCNCGQEGRLRTDAEPGLPRGRSLVAGFPALGTIPWREQEQVEALGWISLGRTGPVVSWKMETSFRQVCYLCTTTPGARSERSPRCSAGRGIPRRVAGETFEADPSGCHSWPLGTPHRRPLF